MDKEGITGIVLAGGKSSRMGTDKSLMQLRGKPLISYAIDTIKPLCNRVVISSDKDVYDFTECEVWPDLYPDQAPMIGIYSCLKRSLSDINIVISCDMPLISTALIEYLLINAEDSDITVPVHDEYMEPLCGIYKRIIVPVLEQYIEDKNYKLHGFINHTSHQLLKIDSNIFPPGIFLNVNTLSDFEQLEANLY